MPKRKPIDHVIIIDGTQSLLDAGLETNAGILYKLLQEAAEPSKLRLHYDPGVQGRGLTSWITIAAGIGINQSICAAYNWLASGYRKGDRIFLFGFSRGAFAARSIAGMIAEVGLVSNAQATERVLKQAFRLYESKAEPQVLQEFQRENSQTDVSIDMVGVWDTVKALGLPYPLLSRLAPMATEFHKETVSKPVKRAYQALAMHETRIAYRPILWETDEGFEGIIEQVWFRGVHSDIGGHVKTYPPARLLSNIPLRWMLGKGEACGLPFPKDWRERYPIDQNAPSVGSFRGTAKLFWLRARRAMGMKCCEYLHPTAVDDLQPDDPVLPLAPRNK